MARYIFITGGVVSSLGKGLASAALGALLQARGFSVRLRKLDPYLNVDPGTMSPFEHGEVFVLDPVPLAIALPVAPMFFDPLSLGYQLVLNSFCSCLSWHDDFLSGKVFNPYSRSGLDCRNPHSVPYRSHGHDARKRIDNHQLDLLLPSQGILLSQTRFGTG